MLFGILIEKRARGKFTVNNFIEYSYMIVTISTLVICSSFVIKDLYKCFKKHYKKRKRKGRSQRQQRNSPGSSNSSDSS